MKKINLFLPAAVFSNFIAIFIRADHDPNRAMAGVVCGGILFPELVCGIFLKPEGEILAIAQVGICHYFWAFLPMAVNVLTGYYLQSILQAKRSRASHCCEILCLVRFLFWDFQFGSHRKVCGGSCLWWKCWH